MNKRSFTFISMLLVLSFAAHAQQNKSSLSMTVPKPKKENPYHISATLEGNSNLYQDESSEKSSSTVLDLIPSIDLSPRFTLGARSVITQEHQENRDTTLSNTQINLSIKGYKFSENLNTSYLVRATAPTSEQAREKDRFQGSGSLAASLAWTNKIVLLKYTLLGNQNSHEYTINAEGSPNIQYNLNQELQFAIEFVPKWTFATTGGYKNAWTYSRFNRQLYTYGAEIGYDVAKSWNIAAGVESNGSVFKPNGTDTNLKFYDENTSVLRASVTFTN